MKKRILLLLICVVLMTAGSFDAAEYPVRILTEEEALITSFENAGADVLESTISCWAKLNNKFLDIQQVETEISEVIRSIDPDKATVVKSVENSEHLNKIVICCSKKNKSYSVAVESAKQENAGETYIVIDVSMDNSYKDLADERRNMINAVNVDESLLNLSSCIIGTYKGKLSEQEVDKKSRIALQSINAKKVEGMENDELKSISAFSSSVGGYIMSDQTRVNVQLAIRYSSYDDKTYLWIGTPLIPMEY